jgi:hypothetical protein
MLLYCINTGNTDGIFLPRLERPNGWQGGPLVPSIYLELTSTVYTYRELLGSV